MSRPQHRMKPVEKCGRPAAIEALDVSEGAEAGRRPESLGVSEGAEEAGRIAE